jgi:predicted dehydrogenase
MIKYRSAIVGVGGRARMHALAYKLISRGELVACCARTDGRREAFAAEFGIPGYADAAEMIRAEKPDLVHLVTPPSTRIELMTLVDALGVPACIVEKPIATEARDWQALVALEAQTGTKFGVGAQFRYHPDLTRCREALRSGRLGAVRFLDASAVGTICDQGVHVVDWAMSLIDDAPPVRVFGAASGADNLSHAKHPSPDTTVAQLLFGNGVYGMWNLGYSAPRVLDDPAYYKHCRVAAYAERGHVLYEEFGRWEIVSPEGVERGHADDCRYGGDQGWIAGNHRAQANLTEAMYDWMEDGGKPVGTNLKRALQQWNAVLGLYASTVSRRPVDLPFAPPEDLWEQLVRALAPES